jgi:hypothetical protein
MSSRVMDKQGGRGRKADCDVAAPAGGAATGMQVAAHLMARDAIVRCSPLQPAALAVLEQLAACGARHEPPLPTACKTALALVQDGDPRAIYDGGFELDGEVADLCLARLWPEYAALEAQAGFATWPSACMARWLTGWGQPSPYIHWIRKGQHEQQRNPVKGTEFPLHGSRLIEASAGTGKTWTIAALYVRLVLGHGGAQGYQRPLLPADILVMTFTRAATRELSNRVRERLVEAAAYFRLRRHAFGRRA